MATVFLGIGFIALFFVLMSVRLILKKDGEFKGTCASQSPFLNKSGESCGFCGKTMTGDESCGKSESEVDKVMAKFS
ncbi:MAG: hypothetical protein RIC03_14665 [Cyclobacteriaceae bacterium]